jgi:hypothetical protein
MTTTTDQRAARVAALQAQQLRTLEAGRLPLYARGKTASDYRREAEAESASDYMHPSEGAAHLTRMASLEASYDRLARGVRRLSTPEAIRYPRPMVTSDLAARLAEAGAPLPTIVHVNREPGAAILCPDAVPSWDYLNVEPWTPRPIVPSVVPSYMVRRYAAQRSIRTRRLSGIEQPGTATEAIPLRSQTRKVRRIEAAPITLFGLLALVPFHAVRLAPMVDSEAIYGASRTPQQAHRWSLQLEAMGTQLLHNAGLPADRPDVWNPRRSRYLSRADRSAHKGTVRYALPSPVRYGAQRGHPRITFRTDGVGELLTLVGGKVDHTAQVRAAWRGHRRVTIAIAARQSSAIREAARAVKREAREAEGATSKRGPSVTPWGMSERSLPRAVAVKGLRDHVAALEAILRTSADGAAVTLSDGVTVTIEGGAQLVDQRSGAAYPVREWCRRAALAGVTID